MNRSSDLKIYLIKETNGTATDVITFVASKAQIGDQVELVTDGTNWYAQCQCEQDDAVTYS
jgi:hypothetical protein